MEIGEDNVGRAPGRWLGVDYGRKRIGLAVSDASGLVASALETIERGSDRRAAEEIAGIARREGIVGIVVGLPRRLDGTAGPAAERSRRFAERLAEAAGLPVELIDEALTSHEAERRLRAAGVDPARHPGRVDAVAAQILLEDALERARRRAGGASGRDEPRDPDGGDD